MSFETLKVAELKDVAAEFAVDLEGAVGKAAIIAALEENGVGFDDYEALVSRRSTPVDPAVLPAEKPKPVPAAKNGTTMVVKMTRNNPRYDAAGFTFTKQHPYVAMTVEQAQELFDLEPEGFTVATPREVQEFYS